MIIEFVCDANGTYATLQPQPSRVSLRKKRIRKAASGYVDLLFYIGLEYGTYVKTADIQFTSDSLYSVGCNLKIDVLDLNKQNSYGTAIFSIKDLWHVGEKVTVGDTKFNDTTNVPLANIFNRIVSDPAYVKDVTAVYLRISFDRENYYSWDRGFFIRPEEEAPRLLLDIGGFSYVEQGLFAKVEDPLPAPSIRGLYIYSAYGVVGNQQLYIKSAVYNEQGLYLASYMTSRNQTQKVYVKSSSNWVQPPASPPTTEHAYWCERGTYWLSFSGDLTSQRTIYFPHTLAEQEDYYIDGLVGSDDFTVSESRSNSTPLRSLEGFFDLDGGVVIDDYDVLHLSGVSSDQLIFNFNITQSTATTPITIKAEDEYTKIVGHIATDGTSRISSVVFDSLSFSPSTAVDSLVASGTTQHMLYLKFINPAQLDVTDPNYYVLFKSCKFLIPGEFPNTFNSLVYFDASDAVGMAKIIVFDTCLFGLDGHGKLADACVSLSRYDHTRLIFRNCSFFNAFNKKGYTSGSSLHPPRAINFPYGNPGGDTRVVFANCAFWNVEYSSSNSVLVDYLRCYNGDPSLVSNDVNNYAYGKYKTTSPCYRKWLPGYGNNIGWDQTIPTGYTSHRNNIWTLGGGFNYINSNIAATFNIRDKFTTNIETAYGRYPYIADTNIITQFSERLHKIASFIGPLDKTLIARQNTYVEGSFPISTDVLYTDLPVIFLPKIRTELPLYKEMLTSFSTHIQTGRDTQCPLVLRYGMPEWYDPVFGPKFYYYFDVYDSGTGVDISSLELYWNGVKYKYGSVGVRIQPLTADKTAYRIEFTPTTPVDPETIHDIDIIIYDCARNKGPIWDARRASEVLHWDVELTPQQKRDAMIPCFFTLYWKRTRLYVETFERFRPPVYNIVWEPLFSESYEPLALGQIFTALIYVEHNEQDFYPYRTIVLEDILYTEEDPSYSGVWSNIFEEDVDNMLLHPEIVWAPLLIEGEPELLVFDSVLYKTDVFEWMPSIAWSTLYNEPETTTPQMLSGLFEDTFNWIDVVDYTLLYTETEPNYSVVWNSLYSEELEWWGGYTIIESILWSSLFVEHTEWFTPYKTDITWVKFAEESREIPEITWISLQGSSFEEEPLSITWTLLFDSDIEFSGELLSSSLLVDDIEWETPVNLTNKIFDDGFEIVNPSTISTTIYEDDLEWMEGIFSSLYIDNMEGDFLPYYTFVWGDKIYSETDPSASMVWGLDLLYFDVFEEGHPDFRDTSFYVEHYEYLGQISYLLQETYMFELVQWTAVAAYSEDYEYIQKLNYFDPFDETFEWEPALSWQETPQIEDDAELVKVWNSYFIEDWENW